MFDYVLVPYDGGPELRAAFAPAADLAWRCDAKLVVVSTTAATDAESRTLVKSLAISQSSADVDFWVDLERSIGDALVEAAAHRPNSLICAASRYKESGLVRRRNVIPIPRQVFTESAAPVMALGPDTVVSAGLTMSEVVMLHDGSARSAGTLATVAEWATGLRLGVRLVSLLSPNAVDEERTWLIERMESILAEIGPLVPSASIEIVESRDPVETMIAFLTEHRDAFFVVGPDSGGSEIAEPGSFAAELLRRSPQALFFPRREVAPPPAVVEPPPAPATERRPVEQAAVVAPPPRVEPEPPVEEVVVAAPPPPVVEPPPPPPVVEPEPPVEEVVVAAPPPPVVEPPPPPPVVEPEPPAEDTVVAEPPPVPTVADPPLPPLVPGDRSDEAADEADRRAEPDPWIDPSEFWGLPFPKD